MLDVGLSASGLKPGQAVGPYNSMCAMVKLLVRGWVIWDPSSQGLVGFAEGVLTTAHTRPYNSILGLGIPYHAL